MKMSFKIIFALTILLTGGTAILLFKPEEESVQTSFSVTDIMTTADTAGYARALFPREFNFPQDHGPHSDFRSEWWYYTGNLQSEEGRKFGFQFTIFRNAIAPITTDRHSSWATNQVYMAHFTVADVQSNKVYAFERFSRGAAGLAGATAQPYRVWLENWAVEVVDSKTADETPKTHLQAEVDGIVLDLILAPSKNIVLQGENGLSRKGADAGNASYYYTIPRIRAHGEIHINNKSYKLKGSAWLDREWSSSALDKNQVGWDWFSLQLNDGREIMYYQIRESNGQPGKFSEGMIVQQDGSYERILPEDVNIWIVDHWTSYDGVTYPSKWQLSIPSKHIELSISPLIKDQELKLSVRYWEGAVEISGTSNGYGYVELTGYAATEKSENKKP